MRKMLPLLITLFLIYFGIEFIYNYFGRGHDIKYLLTLDGKEYKIHEVLSLNEDSENYYYIEVEFDNYKIPYKINNTYYKKDKIVTNIIPIVTDNYVCAKIELEDDKNPIDISCIKDNIIYFYSDLIGQDTNLDNKIKDIEYDINKYKSNLDTHIKKNSNVIVYPNDFPSDFVMTLDTNKGIFIIGSKVNNYIRNINLFQNNIYDRQLSAVVKKNFIVANYNSENEFNDFYIVSMEFGDYYKLHSDTSISFNSYIQGTMDNNLFLIDIDTKKQYKINPIKKTISITNDEDNNVITYNNGETVLKNIDEIINTRETFIKELNTYADVSYDRVIYYNGTYYLFEKNSNAYNVYAIYHNSGIKTYLFTTTSKDQIQIVNDYIYYLDGNNLMVFSPSFGKKIILSNEEFNDKKINFLVQ